MKKLLLASAIFCIASAAQALPTLTVIGAAPHAISGYNGQPVLQTGVLTAGVFGQLATTGPGTVSFSYLGKEAGHINFFSFDGSSLIGSDPLFTTISGAVGSGPLSFSFTDSTTSLVAANGSPSVLIFAGSGGYDAFLGFNDNGRSQDNDFDDFVVGVTFTAAAVPEPETYAMLLAGLGVVGFMALRRRTD